MMSRAAFALSVASLMALTPAALAGPGGSSSNEAPPMLVLNHIGKYCDPNDDTTSKYCTTYYIDWDGRLWREINKHDGLQRRGAMLHGAWVNQDASDMLP